MAQTPPVEIPITAKTSDALAGLEKTWQAVKQVDDNVSKMNASFKSLENVGDTLTRSVTLPLVGLGTAAVSLAMSFEESFAKVSTLFGGVKVDTSNLKDEILELSSATGTSANELNEGLYQALSAGIPVTEDMGEAMTFLTTATQLSKAGFATSTQAVDILTTAINAYGLEAQDAGRLSDVFMEIQNSGKTTISELASVMGNVIPTASAANVNIENLGSAFANLTASGIPTAQAATKINALLAELSTTGSKTDKVLREQTGKSFAQLSEEGVNLADVLAIVDENAESNGLTLKDMFGSVEAGTAALVLAEDGGVKFKDVLDKMGDSAGNTAEAFEIMNNTPMNTMKRELENLKNAGIELGTQLIPIVLDIVQELGKMVTWFRELDPETQKLIINGGLLLAALGPVAKVLGVVGQAGTGVYSAIKNVGTQFGLFKTAAESTSSVLPGVTTNASGLSGVFGAMTATAAGAALSIGAVVLALGVGVWKTVTAEQESLKQAIENTDGAVKVFHDRLKETDDVATASSTWVDKLAKSFGIHNDSISQASESVNKHIDNLAKNNGFTEQAQEVVKNYGTQFGILSEQMTLASTEQKQITAEYGASMIASYKDASNGLLSEVDARFELETEKTNEKYRNLGRAGSEAHEAEINALIEHRNNSKEQVSAGMTEIEGIYQKAWEQNRSLTVDETNRINEAVQTNFVDGMITSMNLTGDKADAFRESWKRNMGLMTADATKMSGAWAREGNTMVGTIGNVAYYVDDTTGKINKLSLQRIGNKNFYVSDDGSVKVSTDKIQGLIAKQIPNKYFTVTQENKVIGNGGHAMFDMGNNANGTNSWRGGLTTVNERIYDEIIDLPNGSRVISATQSQFILDEMVKNGSGQGGSTNTISIQFGDVRIDSDMDIKQIAKQLAKEVEREVALCLT